MKEEKITVIVPAHNEEENISMVLGPLNEAKRKGVIHDAVVVDDGSTDRTAEIVKRAGIHVIQMPVNQGKGAAVLEGIKHAAKNGSYTVVTVDADSLNLTPDQLQGITGTLKKSGKRMVIGYYHEGDPNDEFEKLFSSGIHFSGFRAIKTAWLFKGKPNEGDPFTSKPAKRFVEWATGYGLEKALEAAISDYDLYREKPLWQKSPYRKGKERQDRELAETDEKIRERTNKLKWLLSARQLLKDIREGNGIWGTLTPAQRKERQKLERSILNTTLARLRKGS
ncbi:glycosyltransferase family 2 protein [Candidatus Micrarchaeota archaeon]|nr:glycosyltransferase family 2 protein [Candidatus Micrarchaeota archaeon]